MFKYTGGCRETMISSKRGQGLPLTTIIIAILVIVVLIVLVTFFFSGSTTITRSIRSIFYGTTAGTDMTLAVENCRFYCDQAKSLEADQVKSSAYCTKYFAIDQDNSGEADYNDDQKKDTYLRFFCADIATDSSFRKVTLGQESVDVGRSLNVPCSGQNGPLVCR